MMSELGREKVSAYAAAKGGLKMPTRNIRSEYGDQNIQCNAIGPGYIATPQTAPLREVQLMVLSIHLTHLFVLEPQLVDGLSHQNLVDQLYS